MCSPPQMRRGGAPSAGVVLIRVAAARRGLCRWLHPSRSNSDLIEIDLHSKAAASRPQYKARRAASNDVKRSNASNAWGILEKIHFPMMVSFPASSRTCIHVVGGILRNSSTIWGSNCFPLCR